MFDGNVDKMLLLRGCLQVENVANTSSGDIVYSHKLSSCLAEISILKLSTRICTFIIRVEINNYLNNIISLCHLLNYSKSGLIPEYLYRA